ncbi:MAG: hypothetical protein ACHRXM_28230 [Isosphaerales bacterium]
MTAAKRFVILSGPACAGKGPLQAALARFYPELVQARPVLCHSRPPGSSDVHGKTFYFLPPALIKSLESNPDFVVSKVRSDWQAIDLIQVEDLLRSNDLVFAEVFHTFGPGLRKRATSRGFETIGVFLFPLPPETPAETIIQTMRARLTSRGRDSATKTNERAESAPIEMNDAHAYAHRLLNLAGEDNVEEWGEFGMSQGNPGNRTIKSLDDLGPNAKWLVETFVKICRGELASGDHSRLSA